MLHSVSQWSSRLQVAVWYDLCRNGRYGVVDGDLSEGTRPQYLLAATLLTGVLQIAAGYLKLGSLMRFVSRSVVTGFVNALAILIFMAQLPELTNVTWHVYAMTIAGLGIIYLFPLIPVIGKSVPSPLVCIVGLTLLRFIWG